jgi:ketosteroid isomerase-like protein
MDDDQRTKVLEAAQALADAISKRDERAIVGILAPDFVLRRPGKSVVDRASFLASVREIPVEIGFVRLEQVEVDHSGGCALVTGVQHSQYRMHGETLDEHRPFADWFVRSDSGRWQLKVALELGE